MKPMKKYFFRVLATTLLASVFQESAGQGAEMNAYNFGDGLVFSGKSGYSLNIRGYIQPQMDTRFYSSDSLDGTRSRFRIRRARLRLNGDALNGRIDYRLQLDLSGNSEDGDVGNAYLLDAWVAYNFNKNLKLTFGQKYTPTDNREMMMGSHTLQLVERSKVTSAFASIRDFGFYLDGSYRLFGGAYIKPGLSITNGDGPNVFGKDHGGLKYGGRIDFLPFGTFTNFGQYRQGDMVHELTPKLVVGAVYSINTGMSSRRGRESGAILYLDKDGNESLPDYSKFGVDFMFKYRGLSILGEFVKTSANVPDAITTRVRNDGTTSNSFDVNGNQDVENYVKGRMMLGTGLNLQAGYMTRSHWSIDARYCKINADQYSFLNNGTFYNRPEYYTIGLTKYMGRDYGFKVQGDITYVKVKDGSNDIYGNPYNSNKEMYIQLLTSFAF